MGSGGSPSTSHRPIWRDRVLQVGWLLTLAAPVGMGGSAGQGQGLRTAAQARSGLQHQRDHPLQEGRALEASAPRGIVPFSPTPLFKKRGADVLGDHRRHGSLPSVCGVGHRPRASPARRALPQEESAHAGSQALPLTKRGRARGTDSGPTPGWSQNLSAPGNPLPLAAHTHTQQPFKQRHRIAPAGFARPAD